MGCLGALFKKSNPELAPAYAPPTPRATAATESKVVPPSIPKEVEHFEPCGCGDLSSAFARMSAGDADLPAYEAFSEFKDDSVGPTPLMSADARCARRSAPRSRATPPS